MTDTPEKLIIVNGMTPDQLRAWFEQMKGHSWRGIPLLPAGYEVQVISLRHDRIEPDIEDEP